MKVVLVFCLMILTTAFDAFAAQWYAVSNATGKCTQHDGSPADMIRDYQSTGDNYKVIEIKKIDGKPVIVSVVVVDEGWQVTFYRTLKLCKDTLNHKKKKANDFASRYE